MSTATGAPTASADTTNSPATTALPAADEHTAAAATAAPRPGATPSKATGRARGWPIRFAVLSLVWGFSFLFIKVGTQGFAPLQVTLGRVAFGALVLLAMLVIKRERLPRSPRTWAHLTVAAFFLNALPFSLFAYAELTIPSTLAGICNATSPLWGMALSVVALSED
ncbi:DMT family transporter, partial [Streptomyces decoyicus]